MNLTRSLGLAASCLLAYAVIQPAAAQTQTANVPPAVVTNGQQVNPGDSSPSWSARQNVIESERYDRLLETSRAFREARMRKECGPITDPQLHASCVASFNQYEPYAGAQRSGGG